jgi:succinate dehydrogenase / fumarate reductase cytochrome b subunit
MPTADTEQATRAHRPRPLSPHLSIYRPIVTMVMSIMHRATGMLNIGGLLLVTAYLLSIALGPEAYNSASAVYGSWPARILLVAFTWSMIHHFLGGLRHAFWDAGRAMDRPGRLTLSWGTVVGSVTLTAVLWVVVLIVENF